MRHYPRFKYGAGLYKSLVDGNSLNFGTGSNGTTGRWPQQAALLYPLAGHDVVPVNIAVAGQGTVTLGTGPSTMTARAAANLHPLFATDRLNILFAAEFTNEVKFNGADGAAAWAALKAYFLAARAAADLAGADLAIVAGTAPPALYSSVPQAQIDAQNAALMVANDLLRRDYRNAGVDAVADVAAAPVFANLFASGIFTTSSFNATGAYHSDNVHFTDGGYGLYFAPPYARAATRVRRA
jgi:hypothetical protein